MIRDDLLRFFSRYGGKYTTSQIAVHIDASTGRVHNLLLELLEEEIICRDIIMDKNTLCGRSRIYHLWYKRKDEE